MRTFIFLLLSFLFIPVLTWAQESVSELPPATVMINSDELHARVLFNELEIKQEIDGSYNIKCD